MIIIIYNAHYKLVITSVTNTLVGRGRVVGGAGVLEGGLTIYNVFI